MRTVFKWKLFSWISFFLKIINNVLSDNKISPRLHVDMSSLLWLATEGRLTAETFDKMYFTGNCC